MSEHPVPGSSTPSETRLPTLSDSADDTTMTGRLRVFFRVLEFIERIGNLLPHPFWLFWLLTAILACVSAVLAVAGVEVTAPGTEDVTAVRSLLSIDALVMALSTALENFAGFAPLPIVVSVILGVAVAERSGVLDALLRVTIVRLPVRWVTFAVAFAAMISHVMFDAAIIVLLPLAALAFKSARRSPVLGIAVAYGSYSAGYNASPLVTPSDAILSSLTTQAAQLVDPDYVVTPLANYFWAIVSSVILSITVTVVVETVLARRPGLEADVDADDDLDRGRLDLTRAEKTGMIAAALTLLAYAGVVAAALLPADSPFRGENGSIVQSLVLQNIAIVVGLAFVLIGIVYGRITGSLPRLREVPEAMADGIRSLAPVLVLFFAVAQFLAYFKWTGIGTVIAVSGADALRASGMPPLVILLLIIGLVSVLNLIVTSGSAMWAILAPVLVPMLMYLSISPETTQLVYRIADSCTNAITPMSAYFVLALGMMQRYRKDAGIGTFMSFTIPLALTMLAVWVALFIIWYVIGLPIGPGIAIR